MPSATTRAAAQHDVHVPESSGGTGEPALGQRGAPARWPVAAGLLAVLGVPLVVAAGALRRPQWYPVLDLAMTELRLRDVGSGHTPLIGLPGRIGPLAEQGSHPGPLSFYLLAPLYRLLGSSAWAMQAATIVLDLAALGASLLIAARRGGTRLVIAVAALLALLTSGYGITTLTQPWNPYLPLLWWVVLLLATWSVACDDVAMLPVAVFAGSLCAQTHVSYVALALGLGLVATAATVLAWRHASKGSETRGRVLRWGSAALGLGIVLWAPPFVDHLVNEPGNLYKLYDHLATPPDQPVGLARGIELALVHLDVSHFLTGESGAYGSLVAGSSAVDGSLLPGLALLGLWAVAAVTAVRLRHRALISLHVVVAAGLALGTWSMSRIFDKVWYYLMLWAWAVAGLAVLAVGWTALEVVGSRVTRDQRARIAGAATAALVTVTVLVSGALTADAVGVDPPEVHSSSTLGRVVVPTVDALERGDGAATGRDGRYLVSWTDAVYFGSQAYGLVSELERAGFDAGMTRTWQVPTTSHRVIEPADATAEVVLATGVFVERWRDVPDAVEVTYVEPRSSAERAEFSRLRSVVIDDLRAHGLDDVVPNVDANLFGASIDERISDQAERWLARMIVLGEPTAVFVVPPGTSL
jgi:hypothetical protein